MNVVASRWGRRGALGSMTPNVRDYRNYARSDVRVVCHRRVGFGCLRGGFGVDQSSAMDPILARVVNMGKAQRVKGAVGEREWCELARRYGFTNAKRNLSQTRDAGSDVPMAPFLVEVKRRKGIAVYQWLTQAKVALAALHGSSDAHMDITTPIVAARADQKRWLVILDAEDFLTMARRLREMSEDTNGIFR